MKLTGQLVEVQHHSDKSQNSRKIVRGGRAGEGEWPTKQQQELIEAVNANAWESAICTDCPAQFATQREAGKQQRVSGHSIVHLYGRRAVN
jgi:hypothetical protein